jgi:hypothetical protein
MALWGPPGIWPGGLDKAAAVPIGSLKYDSKAYSSPPSSGHFSQQRSLGPPVLSRPAMGRT